MRVIDLSHTFRKTRALYAPIGSREDLALRAAMRRLGSERHPLPAADDQEAFRTPAGSCWMREIPGTSLVLHYTWIPPIVRVLAVSEAQ